MLAAGATPAGPTFRRAAVRVAELRRQGKLRSSRVREDGAVFQLDADAPAGSCYACGDPLTARRLRYVLRPEVTRTELICRRCGGVEDRPDDFLALEVYLAPSHRRGGAAEATVRLRSVAPAPRSGYCVAAVRKSAELGIELPEPVCPVRVEPGGVAELPFRLLLGDTVRADPPVRPAGRVRLGDPDPSRPPVPWVTA